MNKNLRDRVLRLREAMYYADPSGQHRTVAEFCVRGRNKWRTLPFEAKYFNLGRYDYRTVTRNVWMSGASIVCANGSLPKNIALRILQLADKRGNRSFTLAGYDVNRLSNGGMSVGCSSFTKEDVQHARALLAA